MNISQVKELKLIHEFPEKGAAVLTYFHERGEVAGRFYIGIVESKGNKKFRLRWWDGACEDFSSTEGETEYYKYYTVLSYISYSEYNDNAGEELDYRDIDKIHTSSTVPDPTCIRKYKNQNKSISNIKKEYKPCTRDEITSLRSGHKFKFIYFRGLNDPIVVSGFTRKKEDDSSVYANCDTDLDYTEDEEEFIFVKTSMIVEC